MWHALSVDVEDWYHDGGVPDGTVPECRVERNTLHLLDLFAAHGAQATFFFLGEVAERLPDLVRRTAAAGHEIGSHGYRHRPVHDVLWREFRADVKRSLRILEDTSGRRVDGYRAPYFSIRAGLRWPIETLGELGVRYDSSILAIDRLPGLDLACSRSPFRHHNGLWEVPVAILQLCRFWYLPLASGTGLRLLPRGVLNRCVRRFERDVGSGVFYLHPWELDPESRVAPGARRWLLRVGRRRLPLRLSELLDERRFAAIVDVFSKQLGH